MAVERKALGESIERMAEWQHKMKEAAQRRAKEEAERARKKKEGGAGDSAR